MKKRNYQTYYLFPPPLTGLGTGNGKIKDFTSAKLNRFLTNQKYKISNHKNKVSTFQPQINTQYNQNVQVQI